jgi:hypothetical protein
VWKFLHWIKICESAWSAEYDFGEHFAYATKFIKGTTIFCQIMDKQSKIEGNKLTELKTKLKTFLIMEAQKKKMQFMKLRVVVCSIVV